jgi:hypothetical protein
MGVTALLWAVLVPLKLGFSGFMSADKVTLMMNNCLGAGIFALLVGIVSQYRADQKRLDQFYLLIKTPVGREEELKKAGVDMVYAGHSEGHPWELKHPRLVSIGGFLVALAFSLFILGLLWAISRIGT